MVRTLIGLVMSFTIIGAYRVEWATDKEDGASPLQMVGQGKMSTGATYGHLQFPIQLHSITNSFDELEDIVTSYEQHAMYGGAAKALRHSMSRLSTKVSMIRGMMVPGTLHLALEEDDINQIEEALTRQQLLKREKRSFSTVSQWLGLAGFGSSLYTAGQLEALKRDIDSVSSSHNSIVQTVGFQAARISNLTRYIDDYHRVILNAISQVTLGSKKAAMEIHGRSIQLTLETFTNEIRDLIIGLSALNSGRLHPLLVEPHKLAASFRDLVQKASLSGLAPLKDDPSFLFSCPVSTLVSEGSNDLTIIVHIPFHTGLLDLYRFIIAPILLSDQKSITLTLNPVNEYLAIDAEQTKGGEYSINRVDDCKTYGNVKHCPAINFFTRNVSSLCFYNAMMMQTRGIRENCPVTVKPMKQEIHSLGVNRYLLFSDEQTSISFDCTTNGKQVKTFVGQLYLTMKRNCPIAHSMGFTFSYTSSIYLQRDIVHLPVLYNLDDWLGDDGKSLGLEEDAISQLQDIMRKEFKDSSDFKDGVPLNLLLEKVHSRTKNLISWYMELVQHVVAAVAFVYFAYKTYLSFKHKILPLIQRYIPSCIRRKAGYDEQPVLQNLPLRRVPKPEDLAAVIEEGLPLPQPKLSPL